jgi:hypothetical protein
MDNQQPSPKIVIDNTDAVQRADVSRSIQHIGIRCAPSSNEN